MIEVIEEVVSSAFDDGLWEGVKFVIFLAIFTIFIAGIWRGEVTLGDDHQ